MIVLKFGGIALQDEKARQTTMQRIAHAYRQYEKIIVVVSAMGRAGSPYATDSLLALSKAFMTNPLAQDLAVACGELISAAVLSAELNEFGIANQVLSGNNTGIITSGAFGKAKIQRIDVSSIKNAFHASSCIILPGFQGMNAFGEVMTLGRGGSDLTAVAIADALAARHVEFFKDVDGVYTDDPKINPAAKKIGRISYAELFHYMEANHPLIQSEAVHLAQEKKIPLYVRGIFQEEEGTWIGAKTESP